MTCSDGWTEIIPREVRTVSVTDEMHVHYPTDEELRRLTAERPGALGRFGPGVAAGGKRAGRRAARALSASVRRGWARVRGCLGSLTSFATASTAVFLGWGMVPGLIATAVALLLAEKLLEAPPERAR